MYHILKDIGILEELEDTAVNRLLAEGLVELVEGEEIWSEWGNRGQRYRLALGIGVEAVDEWQRAITVEPSAEAIQALYDFALKWSDLQGSHWNRKHIIGRLLETYAFRDKLAEKLSLSLLDIAIVEVWARL